MAKKINHIHGVSLKTTFTTTLAILYILERITLKECIYSLLVYAVIIGTIKFIYNLLKKAETKLEELEKEI